jgi:hypothetical protein
MWRPYCVSVHDDYGNVWDVEVLVSDEGEVDNPRIRREVGRHGIPGAGYAYEPADSVLTEHEIEGAYDKALEEWESDRADHYEQEE